MRFATALALPLQAIEKLKTAKPYLISAIFATAFGVALGHSTIFAIMQVGIILFVVGVLSFVFLLIGGVKDHQKTVIISAWVIVLIFLIGFATSLTSGIKNKVKQKKAFAVVEKLKEYYEINGVYPEDLTELGYPKGHGSFNYQADSPRQNFSILYLIDGWHYERYDSKTEEWEGGD